MSNLHYILKSTEDFFEKDIFKNMDEKTKERFKLLFEKFTFPITLYVEDDYNDKDYSDIFYNFYSSKFRIPFKYTTRLIFF